MVLNEILEKNITSFKKEKNDKLIESINFLVDEFDNYQNQLDDLLTEIENQPFEDDFFFKNVKKDDYKKRASLIEEKIFSIEKRWSELVLILNERLNKK
jgi:hypothetical protein